MFDDAKPYLDPAIASLADLDPAEGLEYRQMYGAGAGTKYWRRLQVAINAARPDFAPPGLAEYLENEEKQFNSESWDMIAELERFLSTDSRKRLEDEFGARWFKDGVPRKIQVEAGKLAVERNAERDTEDEIEPWECLYIVDYQAVLTHTDDLWKRLFEKRYTQPGDENKPGGRKAKTDWLHRLSDYRNDIAHGRSITVEGYEFLVMITTWLIKGQADNDL